MKKKLCILYSFFVLLLNSCSTDNNENKTESTSGQTFLNVSNAKSLAIIEGSQTKKNSTKETNLYKILNDGTYVPLNFTDQSGAFISPPIVLSMQNLNSNYIILKGTFEILDKNENKKSLYDIIVRKTDGAIFDATLVGFSFGERKLGEVFPKSDSDGNIYYYKDYNSLGKLSLNNPDNLSVIDYLPTGQNNIFFEVDSKGNCMYQYTMSNGGNKYGLRIRKANGGIHEIKVDGMDNHEFWLGNNGIFYFITYTWDNGYIPQINKVNIDGDNISTTVVTPNKRIKNSDGVGSMFRTGSQGSYMIRKEKSVVFIDTYFDRSGMNWEFFEDNNNVEPINLPSNLVDAQVVNSKQYYYISTKTNIYKVNLDTHEYRSLLSPGEFDIYTFTVDNNDNLQFSALRLKDGKKIFAEINKEEKFKITNEEINKKALVIERLDKY